MEAGGDDCTGEGPDWTGFGRGKRFAGVGEALDGGEEPIGTDGREQLVLFATHGGTCLKDSWGATADVYMPQGPFWS